MVSVFRAPEFDAQLAGDPKGEREVVHPLTGQVVSWRPLSDGELGQLQPHVLPSPWQRHASAPFAYDSILLRAFVDAGRELDGRRWLHVSVSRHDGKLPRWRDLVEVRGIFVPAHLSALHVIPRPTSHYDAGRAGHMPVGRREVMHLWACLDGDATPDFLRSRGGVL